MPRSVAVVACSGLITAVKLAALHRNRNMRRAAQHAAAAAHRGSFLVRTAYNEVLNNSILVQNILAFVGPGQHLLREICTSWARIAEAADVGVPVLANRSFLQKVAAGLLGNAVAARHCLQLDLASMYYHMFMGQRADQGLLSLAFELGMPKSSFITCGATCAGRLTTLQWLLEEKQCPFSKASIQYAATHGHINILNNGYAWHADTCKAAVQGGHLAVLQWLYENECPRIPAMLKPSAAGYGRVDIMEWLLQRDGGEVAADLMINAVHTGKLSMCQFLLDRGCPLKAIVCEVAAHNGHLSVLIWLREHKCPWHDLGVAWASARSGPGAYDHLAAAQWLRNERDAPWPTFLYDWTFIAGESKQAQWSGEVLAWARAEGCTSPTLRKHNGAYAAHTGAVSKMKAEELL
eukprot:14279-Heterococcus_DN1.PRE.2